ncbi:hypothetical protein DPMN_137335 [Dreissena polymorpha]|uniref:Uncharacterized protein n=1 Tax=Dreissena polymorpha TaxID=45954 RepID=A0A9D4G1Q2_DREPO|nr:hypothetical protein DPMN_137335 [Dreissena polymorpha]
MATLHNKLTNFVFDNIEQELDRLISRVNLDSTSNPVIETQRNITTSNTHMQDESATQKSDITDDLAIDREQTTEEGDRAHLTSTQNIPIIQNEQSTEVGDRLHLTNTQSIPLIQNRARSDNICCADTASNRQNVQHFHGQPLIYMERRTQYETKDICSLLKY